MKPCPICDVDQVVYERTVNSINLLKCRQCGLVYANLRDEQISEFNSGYDEELALIYAEQQTFADNMWFERIAKKITKMVGHGKVLDIGCGNGVLLKHFLDSQWLAWGLDLSPWARKFAEQYGYELYSCELEQCGLPDGYFDAVTSTSTLEHIPRPYQHIREIMRVLKCGGVAYFAGIPNYNSLSIRLNISSFRNNMPPYHVNYFTHKSISYIFSRPDIASNIEKFTITSYGIPELHRIHHCIKSFTRRIIGKAPSSDPSRAKGNPKLLSGKALAVVMVALYYNPGRLFHLGDKLEVIVLKRS